MQGLIDRIKPKFQSNLHSFGQWLLYPQGWQTGTLDADNPIYVALGGHRREPGDRGFNPGQSADTLYVTNGETTDYADTTPGTIAFTPELSEGDSGGGFVFPDDEALVQAEFERALPFHLGLARSAVDPDDPISPVGITRQAVLPRPGRDRPAERAAVAVRLHVRRCRTAIRRRCGSSPSAALAPSRCTTGSTAAPPQTAPHAANGPAASATAPATARTTTSCAGR